MDDINKKLKKTRNIVLKLKREIKNNNDFLLKTDKDILQQINIFFEIWGNFGNTIKDDIEVLNDIFKIIVYIHEEINEILNDCMINNKFLKINKLWEDYINNFMDTFNGMVIEIRNDLKDKKDKKDTETFKSFVIKMKNNIPITEQDINELRQIF